MAALRWGLYVERVGPFLVNAREVLEMAVDPRAPDSALIERKLKAKELIPALEGLLYPEDVDAE